MTDSPDSAEPDPSTAAQWEGSRRRAFGVLFAAVVSVGMGQSLMFAVLPPIARRLGLSEHQVGAIFAISAVLWVLSSPRWGRFSDVRGRRPVILVGLVGYSVSMAAFALAVQAGLSGALALIPVYVLMIAGRSIFGLFGSATPPAAQAYVAERTPPAERASGVTVLMAAFGLGVTLGPGVVAIVLPLGLLAPFYTVALLGLTSALLVRLALPERATPAARGGHAGARIRPLDPRILPLLTVGIAMGICQASTMQTAGFFAIDALGFTPEASARYVGAALTGAALAALFAQLVLVRRLRLTPRTMLRLGPASAATAFAVLLAGQTYPAMVVALLFLGMGMGLTQPGAIAAATLSVGSHEQGAATGLMSITGATGVIIAPVVGMTLYRLHPAAPYALNLALMLAALGLTLSHRRIRELRVPSAERLDDDDART